MNCSAGLELWDGYAIGHGGLYGVPCSDGPRKE